MIYKTFKIANQNIQTILLDSLPGGEYGKFNDAKNQIILAKTIEVDNKTTVNLTEDQIFNTFVHELVHCFQFYFDNSYNEAQAQVYANFLCEYFKSVTVEDEYA